MIVIKVIIFFLALWTTINMIEEVMQKYLLSSKESQDDLHYNYTHGYMETFGFWNTALTILFWTGFYLVNLL